MTTALKINREPISDEEKERRRIIVEHAHQSNAIEGVDASHPVADKIFEAFIEGEIEIEDLVPAINKAMDYK